MAYELHIGRDSEAIGLAEWKAAVSQCSDMRLCSAGHSITNPKTGEVVNLSARDGDVEIYFAEDQKWKAAFRWFKGKASFRAVENISHPVWRAAVMLAGRLNAKIRGDEAEVYDLKTGKVVEG